MLRKYTYVYAKLACMAIVAWSSSASAQVVERDVSVTGPRGRTINRSTTTERGPGFVDRQVTIKRPGGTFTSNTLIRRAPMPGLRVAGPIVRPFTNIFVERNVFVPPPVVVAPPLLGGLYLGLNAPPPPVVVTPPPVVAITPGAVAATPPAAVVAADPVVVEMGRLHSIHSNTRRDAAIALGRLGDSRAVPALVDHLKNDFSKDVRLAAAWGLAEIGDPAGANALESAALFDKRHEVREAAAVAYKRLPKIEAQKELALKEAQAVRQAAATRSSGATPRTNVQASSTSQPIQSAPRTASASRPNGDAPPPPPTPDEPETTDAKSPFAPQSAANAPR